MLGYSEVPKGGIISENAQDRNFAPVFGDLSGSEKLSKIKPPLTLNGMRGYTFLSFSSLGQILSADFLSKIS